MPAELHDPGLAPGRRAAVPSRAGLSFPALMPRLADRLSALRARAGGLAWLYLLVPVPLLTDWVENGALPTTPRGWVTEVLGGLVILVLVTRVRRDHRALESMARRDALTGLLNRHSFASALDVECARARRSGAPLSVAYLDIDNFKSVNDRFGHAAGDQVLRQFTMAIEQTVRVPVDGAFRLGGDEFALVLAATGEAQARAVVERIRTFCAVHDARWAIGAFEFSAGIVELDAGESAQELIARSDALMYRQKKAHRQATRWRG